CFKRLTSREFRGESSGDLGSERRLRLSGEALGAVRRKRLITVSWSSVIGFRVGYGFLVRLSMFRHLFIDLLEYGGFGC
ncbi:hypothetical protein H5410_035427, partial [Solanum commersonii]